jgi:F420-dependent oxidoreductase-like protein
MKLGFYMGYAQPGTNPLELLELAREAEGLGYDSAWAAEAWGVDAITPLAWLGAQTTTLKLGTAIMQLPGRSPANAAMTAVTLDLLSGGRFLMGLGTSGPQVVEGWHGQEWGKPLGKTREYVEIVRTILRRERLEHHGEHYDIPVQGGTGLGKPLKLMARPLRADIPIYLAAIAPKAVEQTFEIADGWLPIFWSPEQARTVFPVDRARAGRTSTTISSHATATKPRLARSRTSSWMGNSARQRRRCPTGLSTKSPSSARSSGFEIAWRRGAKAARRHCSYPRATLRRCVASPKQPLRNSLLPTKRAHRQALRAGSGRL